MIEGFSIIVAAYNGRPYLERLLASLLSLAYDPYEIIVVDDGSTDGTREYLAALREPRLKIIFNGKNLGTCRARNRGVEQAVYPWLAFIDQDCSARPDWLEKLSSVLSLGSVDFVFGSVVYVSENYRGYFPERLVKNPGARWPMACNLAFKKEILEKLGGFDPDFFVFGNEDTELALRAVSRGYRYERAPQAVVYHQAIDWTVGSLWRSAHYAAVWPKLKKKYPQIYRHFGPHLLGPVAEPRDYLYFLFLPLLMPLLLARYFFHGKRELKIFFAKWPVWLVLRRYYLWRQAVRERVLMC